MAGVWHDAVVAWLTWLRGGALSPETLSLREYQLGRFAAAFAAVSPWVVTTGEISSWLSSHDWGRESVRSYRSALRSFYGYAHAIGRCAIDPTILTRPVRPMPLRPRPASDVVIDAARAHADDRLWLILTLASRYGMRRGELARADREDLSGGIGDRWLLVHGKGGKNRSLPISGHEASVILALPPGALFRSYQTGERLRPATIGRLASRALEDATLHMLRHRFATTTHDATGDVLAIQQLLGHASLETTQRYLRANRATLRRVVETAA